MDIRRIRTKSLLGHIDVSIDLPASGIVAVTGDNGVGKSTIIEAISVCLWGKTLRGSSLTSQRNSFVELVLNNDFVVRRERCRGKTSLEFGCEDMFSYDCATKAQIELNSIVGEFDSWRWSSVLSSQDSLSFALASDSARKKLIESMLSLSVFDMGLEQCRSDTQDLRRKRDALRRKLDVLNERLLGIRSRIEDSKVVLPDKPILGDAYQTLEKALRSEDEVNSKVYKLQEQIISHRSSVRSNDLAIRQLEGDLNVLKSINECPTCRREVDPPTRMALESRVLCNIGDIGKVLSGQQEALARKQRALEDLKASIVPIRSEIESARQIIAEYTRWHEMAKRRTAHSDVLCKSALECEGEILDTEDTLNLIEMSLKELDAVADVLGLRGARNLVVAELLGGLESAANVWLSRVFPKVSLSISGVKQLKSGGTSNKIDVQIDGVGHGDGYIGCSGGERRRIDVALLLALNEIRSHAHGFKSSSLFFDEPFDILDTAGQDSVSKILAELSQNRCVLVVTHQPEFVELLCPEVTYHMVGGKCC